MLDVFGLLKTKWQKFTQGRKVWIAILYAFITTIWKPTDFWLNIESLNINYKVQSEFQTDIV